MMEPPPLTGKRSRPRAREQHRRPFHEPVKNWCAVSGFACPVLRRDINDQKMIGFCVCGGTLLQSEKLRNKVGADEEETARHL
jgi:hypothetical protein